MLAEAAGTVHAYSLVRACHHVRTQISGGFGPVTITASSSCVIKPMKAGRGVRIRTKSKGYEMSAQCHLQKTRASASSSVSGLYRMVYRTEQVKF